MTTMPPSGQVRTVQAGATRQGHPEAVFLVSFVELCGQFSYFSLAALLTLYISSDTAHGGWGWGPTDSVLLFATFGGLIYTTPVAGAWLANYHLGERRCIMSGAVLLLIGYLLLATPDCISWSIGQWFDTRPIDVIRAAGVPLGRLWALADVDRALKAAAGNAPYAYGAARWSYLLSGACFLFGLFCIVIANGLFKASVTSIVAKFYPSADARRDAGYAVFMTSIYIGVVFANVLSGGIGEAFGWHWGFLAAACAMALGLSAYVWKQREYLGNVGIEPVFRTGSQDSPRLSTMERDRIGVLLIQGLFTTIYATAFFQKNGILAIYVRDRVSRIVLGSEFPTTWFLSISAATFLLATPLMTSWFLRLARTDRNPSASYKLAAGLVTLGIAYTLLFILESQRIAVHNANIASVWIVFVFALFGIGDALVWPGQIALATKLSPQRHSTFIAGAWNITTSLGIWCTGIVGSVAGRLETAEVFGTLAALCISAGTAAALFTPRMQKRMHGGEWTSLSTELPGGLAAGCRTRARG